MTFMLHPLRDLRTSVDQIGHAISASAAFTRAAKERHAALSRRQASSGPAPLI